MSPPHARGLVAILLMALALSSCRRAGSEAAAPERVLEEATLPGVTNPPPSALCQAIQSAEYHPLPRHIAGNQLDPSGIVLVDGNAWLINDREGRKVVPPEGTGLYHLNLRTGAIEHVHVPGFDDVSRKFEGLAWDGREMFAIGNVGNREANTFLVSFAVDPATQEMIGEARYHDLAGALGEVTGLGREPWGHGIKIEALAALEPRILLIGLRWTGEGKAHRAYRATVPAPGGSERRLQLEPVPAFDEADLGTAVGGDDGEWTMEREIAGFAEPVCDGLLVAVASAEYQTDDDWEFLSNALLTWTPGTETVDRVCTFDDGLKVEGVAVTPSGADRWTLVLLYDNDSAAPGGYKVVEDVTLPCSRP